MTGAATAFLWYEEPTTMEGRQNPGHTSAEGLTPHCILYEGNKPYLV